MTLTYASQYDGAFGSLGSDGGPNHQIVSEEFLKLLTADEKRGLELQATVRKGRKKFYELVGPEGAAHVAVAGLNRKGWCCTECDHRTWGYWLEGMGIHSFLALSDLSITPTGVFTVGKFPEIELAVTASRWKELLGRRGTRGFVSRLLGIVSDDELVRRPDLPPYLGNASLPKHNPFHQPSK
jgi:hypothetical protein